MHVFIFQVCGSDKDQINIKMISYVDKFGLGAHQGDPNCTYTVPLTVAAYVSLSDSSYRLETRYISGTLKEN